MDSVCNEIRAHINHLEVTGYRGAKACDLLESIVKVAGVGYGEEYMEMGYSKEVTVAWIVDNLREHLENVLE